MEACAQCHEYGIYCTCDETFINKMDQLWEYNIDARICDEYYLERAERNQPFDEEIAKRNREEIEMLIDLDLD